MSSRATSLLTLRAFEAAARRLSFTNAAHELFVSQGDISGHVRQLETQLGRPLFRRLHRRVELTECGERLARELTRAFSQIARARSRFERTPVCGLSTWLRPLEAGRRDHARQWRIRATRIERSAHRQSTHGVHRMAESRGKRSFALQDIRGRSVVRRNPAYAVCLLRFAGDLFGRLYWGTRSVRCIRSERDNALTEILRSFARRNVSGSNVLCEGIALF